MDRIDPSASTARTARPIAEIHRPPGLHWVGDGFRVAGYFSTIPDAARKLSPFLMMDYHPPYNYPPSPRPRGVGVHPHRGFETVTLAWQGSVSHHDSAGGGGTIGPGDVQWMTAASGVLHKEYHEKSFSRTGGVFHMVQLWVNLPRAHKMDPPRYQAITADRMGRVLLEDDGGEVCIVAGEYRGVRGPALTFSPVRLFDIHLKAGGKATFEIPARENLSLLIVRGTVGLNGNVARADDFVIFRNQGDLLVVEAAQDAHLLLLGGEPINEPVVQYGPFVMNTEREIMQAVHDFNQGRFGHLDD